MSNIKKLAKILKEELIPELDENLEEIMNIIDSGDYSKDDKDELKYLEEIKAYFTAWENALVKIFENKYPKIEASNLAKEFVALTQGAIMMMNLYDSSQNYLKVGEKIISLI